VSLSTALLKRQRDAQEATLARLLTEQAELAARQDGLALAVSAVRTQLEQLDMRLAEVVG